MGFNLAFKGLNLDFDTKGYTPCLGYFLVNPEMSAGDRYCSRYEYPTKNRKKFSACSKATIDNREQEKTKEESVLQCDENRYRTIIRRTEKGSSK